jgi:uncharacterized protein YqeY
MSTLQARLRADLTAAMKARDELTTATLRMVLAALSTESVAGRQARELSDAEVVAVLTREARKRREAATVFDAASRPELADRERAEGTVLDRYLPAPLADEQLVEIVRAAIVETGASELRHLGQVMKALQPKVAGRADGKRVADAVRQQLGG